MRCVAIIAASIIFCLLTHLSWAQNQPDGLGDKELRQPEEPCTSFPAPAQRVQSGDVPVIGVSFSGNLRMPIAEQSRIANELKQLTYSEPLDDAGDELVERVKHAWQDRGFFKVDVNGEAMLTSRGADHGLALSVHINEGAQYRLGGISFQHNNPIPAERLRAIFQVKDGEVFSRSRVAEGLQNLRKVYGEFGYINYTGAPNTRFDEIHRRVYVAVDIDEGKQFYVERLDILGLDDASRELLLR
jgi:outer membrane protein assembly factor BamA